MRARIIRDDIKFNNAEVNLTNFTFGIIESWHGN